MADASADASARIQELEERHAEDPQGRYLVALANEYRKAGEIDHAEHLLEERLRQTPGYLSAHIVLGRCFADRGALDAAGEEFLYVLSIDPQNLIALRSLGEIALGAERLEEAQRWYRELLAVDPMNEDARLALEQMGADAEAEFEGVSGWWQSAGEEVERAEEATPPDDAPEEFPPETLASTAVPVAEDVVAPPAAEPLADGADGDVEQVSAGEEEHTAPAAGERDEESGESDELVSETIGDLYAQQGFHQRAAQVYETLLRTRGEDPALRSKLADLRAWMAGEREAETLPSLPAADAAEPADLAAESAAELEQEEILFLAPPPATPDLLPLAAGSLASETAALTDRSDPEGSGSDEAEAGEDEDEEDEWESELFAASFGHGFGADEEAARATGIGSEEAEEDPGLLATGPETTISAYLSRLLSWRPSSQPPVDAEENPFPGEGTAGTQPQGDPWSSADVPEQDISDSGVPGHPGEGAESTGGAPAVVNDSTETDDDLESFQAWLRSLKP